LAQAILALPSFSVMAKFSEVAGLPLLFFSIYVIRELWRYTQDADNWITRIIADERWEDKRYIGLLIFFALIVKIYRSTRTIRALEHVPSNDPAANVPVCKILGTWLGTVTGQPMEKKTRIMVKKDGVVDNESTLDPDRIVLFQATDSYSKVRFENGEYAATLDGDSCSGFGEHVLLHGVAADGICIGDVWRVKGAWTGVELEVSAPHKPGAEVDDIHHSRLRGRGGIRDQTLRRGLAGWHCRVRQPGPLTVNDALICVKRPNPSWSVCRAARVLYGAADSTGNATLGEGADTAELRELAGLCQLAASWRTVALHLLNQPNAAGDAPANEGKKDA